MSHYCCEVNGKTNIIPNMEATYDVVNEAYSCVYDSDSSDDSTVEGGFNFRSIFRRRRGLRTYTHSEVAHAPSGCYWDLSSEYFMRAMSLKPQAKSFNRCASLNNIPEATRAIASGGNLESFKSIGDLLTLDEEDPQEKTPIVTRKPKKSTRVRFSTISKSVSVNDALEIKVLVIGDHFVGKSAIIRRFVHGVFDDGLGYSPPYNESKIIRLQNVSEKICLHICDVANEIGSHMLANIIGAIIVFDLNDPKSFASVKKWKRNLDLKAQQAKFRNKVPCVLFANKCDSDVTFDMCSLDAYCLKRGFLSWFDTSAKIDFNVKNGFVFLAQKVLELHSLTYSQIKTRKAKRSSFNLGFGRKLSPPPTPSARASLNYAEENCSTML